MEKYNSIEKSWIASLGSGNTTRMIQTIYEIRNSGSINMLPALFEHINPNTDARVKDEIIRLISEIKTQNAASIIARLLAEHEYANDLTALIAACWQSGLDFSEHLKVFVAIFIKGDYGTALEAFTVIEESLVNATDKQVSDCIHYLVELEPVVNQEKLPLFIELRKVVENY